jgi:hypothetical protein
MTNAAIQLRSCYMPNATPPFAFCVLSIVYSRASIVATRLLVIVLSLVVDDVEEAELVDALGGGNDAEPVTELLLLEELLGATQSSAPLP